jgi:Leucine-rich repeat (LRR) protein
MWLPQELARLVGSYLDPLDLRVCTMQLCTSGTGFVSAGSTNHTTTMSVDWLVACCRSSTGAGDVAQECTKRIELFLARRGEVHTIIINARQFSENTTTNASVYPKLHRYFQQGSSFQLSQNQGITVEWHISAKSIAQVEFLLKVDVPKDGARVSDTRAARGLRQHLHTLYLGRTQVSDLSSLSSCKPLHTLYLGGTQVSDVSGLESCTSLDTLDLSHTQVSDVSVLASCTSLQVLDLSHTQVSDVSALASCKSLYTLDLSHTRVIDVSVLASCTSLDTLDLANTQVSDVAALTSCKSLCTLILRNTQVSDVSALASCQSLHTLFISGTQVSDVSALASCQSLISLSLMDTLVTDVSALASCQSLIKLRGAEDMIGGSEVGQMPYYEGYS